METVLISNIAEAVLATIWVNPAVFALGNNGRSFITRDQLGLTLFFCSDSVAGVEAKIGEKRKEILFYETDL